MLDITEFDELLIPRRAVLIGGDVDEDCYDHIKPLPLRYALESKDLVTIIIDSQGGDGQIGMQLFDIIRAMTGPTKGIVIGKCWSIALPILQACTDRTATEHSTFVIHEVHSLISDFKRSDRAEIAFMLQESLRLEHQIEKVLLSRSRVKLPKLRKLTRDGEKHNVELSAAQALKLGFIDRIIAHPFASEPEK